MKEKTKKIIYKTIKAIWFTKGTLILAWTLFWFIKIQTIGDLGGVLAGTVLFASGIYLLAIYLAITLLFLLIKWIVKKIRK